MTPVKGQYYDYNGAIHYCEESCHNGQGYDFKLKRVTDGQVVYFRNYYPEQLGFLTSTDSGRSLEGQVKYHEWLINDLLARVCNLEADK